MTEKTDAEERYKYIINNVWSSPTMEEKCLYMWKGIYRELNLLAYFCEKNKIGEKIIRLLDKIEKLEESE